MSYEIYYIKNTVNDKLYIGQTIAGIDKRWGQHKAAAKRRQSKLYSAMRKHGVENFSIHKICSCKNIEDLNAAEEFLILYLNTVYDGYNIHAGGLNYERPIDLDKLSKNVVTLLTAPPQKDIASALDLSARQFKVLMCFIQILLSFPDVPIDDENICDISEAERLTLKKKMNKLWHGWPGERVRAAYILFMGLCAQKGIL